jgi:hypothetical protein
VGAFATIYGGNALLDNSGDVSAYASGYFDGRATGVAARSSLLSATVYNSGSVGAQSYAMHAYATGAYVTASESASVHHDRGSEIVAIANGLADATAYGAQLNGLFANVYGEGSIAAAAYADAGIGDARAYGAHAYGSFTGIYNLGDRRDGGFCRRPLCAGGRCLSRTVTSPPSTTTAPSTLAPAATAASRSAR